MKEDIIKEAKEIISKKLISCVRDSQGSCNTLSTLAKFLNIGSTSLYRWRKKESLPTKLAFEKLQNVLKFTEAEITLMHKAIARRNSLSGLSRWKNQPSYRKEKTEKIDTAKPDIEERVRELEKTIYGARATKASKKNAEKLISNFKAPDWNIKSMRFILTRDNFKELDVGQWSAEEISDTAKLAQELRRRLVILAQNPNPAIREDHLKCLAKELDELWRAYSIANSIAPLETAELINLERQNFLKIEKKKEPERRTD